MAKSLILCDCLGSQTIDAKAIERATGLRCSKVHTSLCTSQAQLAASEIAKGDRIIACAQEQALFQDLAEAAGVAPPPCVDLRDRAGWARDGDRAGPKMAALVADALLSPPQVKMVDLHSDGRCLVIGAPEVVLPVAEQLAPLLAVSVLVPEIAPADIPLDRRFDLVVGQVKRASGALGGFELRLDQLRQVLPAGRGAFALSEARNGATTQCDLILDLRGDTPLFAAGHKRDGYLRADPGDAGAVARAVLEASHLVGDFDKPLYTRLETQLCAHSRAGITGCSRCLDACPTGAIAPDGDHVAVDPMICAGCGGCSAVCPSGAIAFDAPDGDFLFQRMRVMAQDFEKAGGSAPRLLVHDGEFGAEIIRLGARFFDGLPADMVPLEVASLSSFGHAEMLAALAGGWASVTILLAPGSEADLIGAQAELAQALGGSGRIELLRLDDPEALCDTLYAAEAPALAAEPVLAMGSRRQVTRLAARALCAGLDTGAEQVPIPLPDGAPYGALEIDTDACTLCLACVSLCPSGALGDNPDAPQLRFQEDACLQCGLCARACPEQAITLVARMDLSEAALTQKILHEEEPFACIECGTPFGVRSTIEKIIGKLAGKHEMFATSNAARLIQMCDDCRVRAQYHDENSPLRGGARAPVTTTEDYLTKQRRDN